MAEEQANDFEETIKETTQKISVYTPILYLIVLITVFIIFTVRHRKNKFNYLAKQKPFFGENYSKEMYLAMKGMDPKPNAKVLKAALLRRGAESIKRTLKLKEVTPFMKQLYERGSIGDELWERFETAQKLESMEVQELINEAESLKPGWTPKFVPLLSEICFNEPLRRRYEAIAERKDILLKQWGIDVGPDGQLILPNSMKSVVNDAK